MGTAAGPPDGPLADLLERTGSRAPEGSGSRFLTVGTRSRGGHGQDVRRLQGLKPPVLVVGTRSREKTRGPAVLAWSRDQLRSRSASQAPLGAGDLRASRASSKARWSML